MTKPILPTRDRLLRAASQIIQRSGVSHLTLDAVAQEAQVSKGGLLYHFPSKELLLAGLVGYLLDVFNHRLDAEIRHANEPEGTRGRWLRAYVRATFNTAPDEYEITAALAIVVTEEPSLRDFLKENFVQLRILSEQDGIEPTIAALIRFAVDGLWFNEVLQLSRLEEPFRTQLFDRLMRLTEEQE